VDFFLLGKEFFFVLWTKKILIPTKSREESLSFERNIRKKGNDHLLSF